MRDTLSLCSMHESPSCSLQAATPASLRSAAELTGARAKAAIISSAPPKSAARPMRYCLLLAYCSSIFFSMLKRGNCLVASFCSALPTLLPTEATMVTSIASHMSKTYCSWGRYAFPMVQVGAQPRSIPSYHKKTRYKWVSKQALEGLGAPTVYSSWHMLSGAAKVAAR